MAAWQLSGEYMETCNCTFVCPCIATNLTARPTDGDCKAAIAMRIDKGAKEGVTLDGLSFIVMLHSPGPMVEGNMTVGLIIDERATVQQVEAITAIATGSAGGPMAALGAAGEQDCGCRKTADPVQCGGAESGCACWRPRRSGVRRRRERRRTGRGHRHRQRSPPSEQTAFAGKGHAQSFQCFWNELERFERHAQWPFRALCVVGIGSPRTAATCVPTRRCPHYGNSPDAGTRAADRRQPAKRERPATRDVLALRPTGSGYC